MKGLQHVFGMELALELKYSWYESCIIQKLIICIAGS
jgi:hypothetical protein